MIENSVNIGFCVCSIKLEQQSMPMSYSMFAVVVVVVRTHIFLLGKNQKIQMACFCCSGKTISLLYIIYTTKGIPSIFYDSTSDGECGTCFLALNN